MNAKVEGHYLPLVGAGLMLVFLGTLLTLIGVIGELLLPHWAPKTYQNVAEYSPVLALAATALGLAGRMLCLSAPRQLRTRGMLGLTFVLDAVAIAINVGLLAGHIPRSMWPVALLTESAAAVLFVVVLMRLAVYVDHLDAIRQAENLLWWGGFYVAFVLVLLASAAFIISGHPMSVFAVPVIVCLRIAIVAMTVVMIYRYLQLVNWLRAAVSFSPARDGSETD